ERFLHTNEESGWAVALFDTQDAGCIRAVGTFLGIQAGETLELTGRWVEHPKFGRQLKVASFDPVEPVSLQGIEAYLASFIEGITARLAKKIVRHFGKQTLDVLAAEPDRLIEVHGIGKKRKKRIVKSWRAVRKIREVMVFLQSFGIPAALAAKIFRHFADRTIAVVRANPYQLMEVRGVGFHKADAIARSRGIAADSLRRAGAAAIHRLDEASAREGHMFLRRPELRRRMRQLLALAVEREDEAIEELCRKRRLRAVGSAVYLRRLENAERTVADRLQALLAEAAAPLAVDVELAITKFEAREQIVLAEAQRQTLREMVASKVMVLTGGPGTGKTTLTKGIVYVASLAGLTVELAAPTGRAAKRLAEATGLAAKTIHRLLGYQGEFFTHDEDNPLEADLLVVDEASMVDAPLARHLLRALPDSVRLVIVGDVDQLPSVGPGRVLGDLIESRALPVVRLTEIFRQARKSLIVVNAHRVIHGELPVRGEPDEADFFVAHRPDPAAALAEVTDLVATRIAARYGFDPQRDIQVLAPMRRGLLGVENLNLELQKCLNPDGETASWRQTGSRPVGRRLRRGDRVMQTTNNYELEVFNGEIGTVAGFDDEERQVRVGFDGRVVAYSAQNLEELELAYAVTIHKAQGSEFPCVVIVLHDQHRIMLQRNLLYTAITRGKQLVLVVGTRQAVATAIRTETTQRRETLLVERLQGRLEETPSTG
ncbi:MAG: ATP-dependent RecD-like DNA helicase, partial [Thermoanaerobaculia bacterium]